MGSASREEKPPLTTGRSEHLIACLPGGFRIVRVRIQWEIPRVSTGIRSDHAAALTLSALLAPASLAAFTIGFWRIAVQLRWMNPVLVWDGALSHGPVWLVAAAVLLVLVSVLDRYGHRQT